MPNRSFIDFGASMNGFTSAMRAMQEQMCSSVEAIGALGNVFSLMSVQEAAAKASEAIHEAAALAAPKPIYYNPATLETVLPNGTIISDIDRARRGEDGPPPRLREITLPE